MTAPAVLRPPAAVRVVKLDESDGPPRPRRVRWWAELLLALTGYALYAVIRNSQGKAQSPAAYNRAVKDSSHVVNAEKHLGVYHEKAVQHLAEQVPLLLRGLDTFWSLAYLLVTVAVIIWLIRWQPQRYRRLRTVFVLATAAGLIVFAFFPSVPPRMLPQQFGFIDTWTQFGGIGMKTPPRIERISDPFASMPSLHVAWAVWCALAIAPACKRRWGRALAWGYASLTIVAVIATGNHFILDVLNGTLLVVVALVAVNLGSSWLESRAGRRLQRAISPIDLDGLEVVPAMALSESGAAA